MMGQKDLLLTIELVPKTCWYSNVRSNVTKHQWDIIRHKSYNLANNKCEICGSSGILECHEIWQYDDVKHIQTLIRFIALCNRCHTVKHPGLAKIKGKSDIVEQQLIRVNHMTHQQAIDYLIESFQIFDERSKYQWTLDISYINEYLKQ